MLANIKHLVLSRFARALRPYLARAPLIWGNESRLQIGSNVHLVDALINLRSGTVTIGNNAFFGHGVMLLTGKHDMSKTGADRHEAVPDAGRDIKIGAGAWIASGCIVIAPCEIGENAVVGAGSVVMGVVPAGAVFSGNPARLVRLLNHT